MDAVSLVPIDASKISQPWDLEITQITSVEALISVLQENRLTRTEEIITYINFCHRAWIIHWLIKLEWDSKHKLPRYPKGHKETYKPLAELYQSVLHLCKELHLYLPDEMKAKYRDAGVWFKLVFLEGAIEGISYDEKSYEKGKSENLKLVQKENQELKEYKNPFDPVSAPATALLITYAIRIAESNNVWRRNNYKPFRDARSRWVQTERSMDWHSLRIVNDELYIQKPGRGKVMKKVS